MGIIKESGKSVYIDDTWRLEKGQKVGDYTGRELDISDDVAATESTGWVEGKYESMDGSWKGSGTCTYIDKDGGRAVRKLGGGLEQGHLQNHRWHGQVQGGQW